MKAPQYEIRVRGHLAPRHSDWLGLNVRHGFQQSEPVTLLSGPLPDQAALHGVLNKLQNLGLVLLELRRLEP